EAGAAPPPLTETGPAGEAGSQTPFPAPGTMAEPVEPPEEQPAAETAGPAEPVEPAEEQPTVEAAGPAEPPPAEAAAPPPEPPAAPEPAPFPAPGPETGESGVTVAGDIEVPQPRWQTVDQSWDQVKVVDSPQVAALTGEGASFKEMDVGASETGRPEGTTPLPPQGAPGPTAEQGAAAPGAEMKKPGPVPATGPKPVAAYRKYRKHRVTRPAGTAPAERPGRGLELAIINESGDPEQGQAYRQVLEAMGYKVSRMEDRGPTPGGGTTILYNSGRQTQAQALAQRLPGRRQVAPLETASPQDLVIVVR
ncbi:MAG: LytR C-terminal domain-containing protein, partial [Thermodesulfobacteriota bacterium]